LGIVSTMNHIGIYFGCVFATLFAVTFGLVLIARKTMWKPKPIKPLWAALVICGAVILAGAVCSVIGRDIHILYWWLVGTPVAAVGIVVVGGSTNYLVNLWLGRKK
jgi:hypothetical protein